MVAVQLSRISGTTDRVNIYEGNRSAGETLRRVALSVPLPYTAQLDWKASYTFVVENLDNGCGTLQEVTISGPATTAPPTTLAPVWTTAAYTPPTTPAPTTRLFTTVPITTPGPALSLSIFADGACSRTPEGQLQKVVQFGCSGGSGTYQLRIETFEGTVVRDWDYAQTAVGGFLSHVLAPSVYTFILRDAANPLLQTISANVTIDCPPEATTEAPTTPAPTTFNQRVDVTLWPRQTAEGTNNAVDIYLTKAGAPFAAPVELHIQGRVYYRVTTGGKETLRSSIWSQRIPAGAVSRQFILSLAGKYNVETYCIETITPESYDGNQFINREPCTGA